MRALLLRGHRPYAAVHALQEQLVAARAAGEAPDVLLLLEHEPTYTVGRAKGAEESVFNPGDTPVVRVPRGGDATWHGPGQLVAYPILALAGARADLHDHLHRLERAVIALLAAHGLNGHRDARNTGVWLDEPDGQARKVCSVGIACRRWVTWHGLALNVSPEMEAWQRIRPCGFDADVMTSLARHLASPPTVAALAPALADALADALDAPLDGPLVTVPDEAAALVALQAPA